MNGPLDAHMANPSFEKHAQSWHICRRSDLRICCHSRHRQIAQPPLCCCQCQARQWLPHQAPLKASAATAPLLAALQTTLPLPCVPSDLRIKQFIPRQMPKAAGSLSWIPDRLVKREAYCIAWLPRTAMHYHTACVLAESHVRARSR